MTNRFAKSFVLLMCVGITSCVEKDNKMIQDNVWVPIYKNKTEVSEIKKLPPQPTKVGGKIYAYNNYLFQLEPGLGIHLFELEDKTPVKKHFVQIYGAQEIAIKNDRLYTNNYTDLIVLDISELTFEEKQRTPNAFNIEQFSLPPQSGYFQCEESNKGLVVGWELQHDIEANCRY